MNIALPALIVFFILLPGFVVRSRFKRAERASLDYSPFGQVVTEAVLWAGLLHSIWLGLSWVFFHFELRADVLLKLLSADAGTQAKAIDAVAPQARWVWFYFCTLLLGAYAAPALARRVIIEWRLDRIHAPLHGMFRFHGAPWYYLLTGADFTESEQPDFVVVSAMVNVAGEAYLYKGILDEFFCDQDGTLDRLILEQAMRRPLASDKAAAEQTAEYDNRFYQIDGDYFVLRYSEAITLNILYVRLEDPSSDVADPAV